MRKVFTPPPKGFCDPRTLAGLPKGAPLAVALSGGADSVALLAMLAGQGEVCALHVHHGIRGSEADRDAAFCRTLAKELGVAYAELCLDVPTLARERGESLETAAREARYAAMQGYLEAHGIPLLVTAHHADDQLETLLQHLLRGAGLSGLCGIPPCRALGGVLVARPLLDVTKEEILAYVKENNLSFVTDSTNEKRFCQRNRLRLDVIPILREIAPDAPQKAALCVKRLSADEQYLTAKAEEFLSTQERNLSVTSLAALPYPIFVRVMRQWLPSAPSATHLSALHSLVLAAKPHASLSLPCCRVAVEGGMLCKLPQGEVAVCDYQEPVLQGENEIACASATVVLGAMDESRRAELLEKYPYFAECLVYADSIQGELFVRPRKEGDQILSGGMHKTVRRLRGLSPLPTAVRARMPLLCDGAGVLAVPCGAVRDGRAGEKISVCFFFS